MPSSALSEKRGAIPAGEIAAVEERPFHDPRSVIDGGRDDPERDVRRIERVMAERRGRIVSR